MYRIFTLLLSIFLLAACSTPAPGSGGTSGQIKAAAGGVLEAAGAKLTIPPGALSRDATVTFVSKGKASEPAENPLQPAGISVALDLGGAELKSPASLELPVDATGEGSLVVLETRPEEVPGEARHWVHAAQPLGAASARAGVSAQALPGRAGYSLLRAGLYATRVIRRPKTSDGAVGSSLQVPFYWQAVYPWCTPTSLAMALNYYKPHPAISGNSKFPGGFVSNYGLASLLKQPADSGSFGGDIVKATGIPETAYSLLRWDAELVPSDKAEERFAGAFDAFKSYALTITASNAFRGNTPLWTASDRQSHAFVLTGLTSAANEGVFINNSNDRWAGTHPSQTWKEFREANCTLKDPNDPSKGCADKATTRDPDLKTIVFYADPKPEAERRGSIELLPGGYSNDKGIIIEAQSDTIRFSNLGGETISRWMWDGTYTNGYYFSDAAKLDNRFPSLGNLPFDNEFYKSIYRSSKLETVFNLVNITNQTLDYELGVRLYIGGTSRAQKILNPKINAHNFERIGLDWGNLADLGAISTPTPARLEFNLRQNGVVQDIKHVSFRLVPDPTEAPKVRIISPPSGVTVLKGSSVTFRAEAFDSHALPDGRLVGSKLTWREGLVKVGEGTQFAATYPTAGSRTLVLVARNDYGVQATATVSVNVIDPTRTPGEIVILSPTNNQQFNHEQGDPAVVLLSGYATYSDGSAVPGSRLVWTRDGASGEIGRGSNVTTELTSGVFDATYTLRLTVLSADGQSIGSRSVSIKVVCNACVN